MRMQYNGACSKYACVSSVDMNSRLDFLQTEAPLRLTHSAILWLIEAKKKKQFNADGTGERKVGQIPQFLVITLFFLHIPDTVLCLVIT